ncbi:MAG: sigma-54-dependent Fis family transcriptional regulator [Sandaracinus sp.]|nr:sigma-54-dependent Fis family transcriptional regulator [Sandaracinus sp.]MCB9614880.1 sigma-54-dependent Fis family transcriptional regulator [Sandaracinus sp.]MCB9618632.1 sigma-54-dependent Fis family transcriptional regulator [Sandaracinus sp.]MCB9632565.1 sigma-54-dependent Fis family transcriptional regulator [Sandaracinus sp.]
MTRVLVADDEENLRLVLRTLLKKHGYEVQVAASAEEALARLGQFDPDFVLADVRMPGMSGIELVAELKKRGSEAVAIVMSAYGSVELALEAMKAGAYDYVAKPFKQDEVLLALRKAEEREQLRKENARLRAEVAGSEGLGRMIGRSDPMRHVFKTLEKVAGYKTTVLVLGESGTGKELVARALHELSDRKGAPFVAVNCGAIPGALLESELFGHKRGAFTDAHADKRGLFEVADGGTLFLDELGELPAELQVKLLRVLQEGSIRALGTTQDKSVDVRVVAATVRDLAKDVKEGRFREDLFYRLDVLRIEVPPLRERRDDVPLLVARFLERLHERLGTRARRVSAAAMERLLGYEWPGNVRELENVIERAVVLAEGDEIQEGDLPERLHAPSDPAKVFLASGDLSIKRMQSFMERELIARALQKTGGNKTAAAKLLEISHRALLYKVKDYGLD